jgi:ribonuclease Z
MSLRQFVALGTQSQAPTRKRNHHAGLLRWDDIGILFDPGEGTQRQLAHANISPSTVTHVCITHFHGDHCLGLPGVVQRLSLDRCAHPVHVFYPAAGQRYFERLRFASIFADNVTIVPHPVDHEGVLMETPDWVLSARALDHRVETYGYRLQEKNTVTFDPVRLATAGVHGPSITALDERGQLVVAGRMVRKEDVSTPRKGQTFAFVMDTRPCRAALELAREADLMVMEATFSSEHAEEAREYAHCTAAQTARIALNGAVRKLCLTHFSQRYDDVTPLLDEARAIHPQTVALNDLDVVNVPKRVRALTGE